VIFRIDDVNPSTNFKELEKITNFISFYYPDAEIWNCVSLIGKRNVLGAVHPNPPFKDKQMRFFYNSDSILAPCELTGKIVSHGLLHFDHSTASLETQELSILTSCSILQSSKFVPPFNRWNYDTEKICLENGIDLVKVEDGWVNLDRYDFNPVDEYFYFHPWNHTADDFIKKIGGGVKSV